MQNSFLKIDVNTDIETYNVGMYFNSVSCVNQIYLQLQNQKTSVCINYFIGNFPEKLLYLRKNLPHDTKRVINFLVYKVNKKIIFRQE